jgi:hypothetical protein
MKRKTFFWLVSFIMLSVSAVWQDPSPEAEAFFQKAMGQINPKHTTWIKKTAAEANDKNLN